MPCPLVFAVALKASEEVVRQVLATRQALRRALEGAISQGTSAGADERPPADGQTDENRQYNDKAHNYVCNNL
jgi:hypothetical protein